MHDLIIKIENKAGAYKSFHTEGDSVWEKYPLKGVMYPVDYGYIEGYEGEDGAELDIFVGTGTLLGFIKVWRLDVPEETKMFRNLTEQELNSVLTEFKPVLVTHKILDEESFYKLVDAFKTDK